jgi:hypothetical protein
VQSEKMPHAQLALHSRRAQQFAKVAAECAWRMRVRLSWCGSSFPSTDSKMSLGFIIREDARYTKLVSEDNLAVDRHGRGSNLVSMTVKKENSKPTARAIT